MNSTDTIGVLKHRELTKEELKVYIPPIQLEYWNLLKFHKFHLFGRIPPIQLEYWNKFILVKLHTTECPIPPIQLEYWNISKPSGATAIIWDSTDTIGVLKQISLKILFMFRDKYFTDTIGVLKHIEYRKINYHSK